MIRTQSLTQTQEAMKIRFSACLVFRMYWTLLASTFYFKLLAASRMERLHGYKMLNCIGNKQTPNKTIRYIRFMLSQWEIRILSLFP